MNSTTLIRVVAGVLAFVIIILASPSCVDRNKNEAVPAPVRVDSDFSSAPVSPGGTGGVPDTGVASAGEATQSFFTAFQLDPEAEDSAGPKFVVAGDINHDGLLDLVSAWNQSQPVQLHLQQRDGDDRIAFRTITLAGTTPVAIVAGVALGYINNDDWLDVVVLVKSTGYTTICLPPPPEDPSEPRGDPSVIGVLDGEIVVLFNPGDAARVLDGDSWHELIVVNPLAQAVTEGIHDHYPGLEAAELDTMKTKPELGGYTSLAVGNLDGRPGDDIVVALNPAECRGYLQKPPINTVDVYLNPGADVVEGLTNWGDPVSVEHDAPNVAAIALHDVDGDGDLDIVSTYTTSVSRNVRWARNPLIPHAEGGPSGPEAVRAGTSDGARFLAGEWQFRPIGQLDTGAEVMALGDIDGDGHQDVVVRSSVGQLVQWFRRPSDRIIAPEFPPNDPVPDRHDFPWPVFTLTEFRDQEPEAIALGDLTGDGQLDLVVAAEGSVLWLDGSTGASVFDPWVGNPIISDNPPDSTTAAGTTPPAGSGVGVQQVDTSTHVNCVLIVDLDADGRPDVIATLDRRARSGLTDDRLVWYRNVRTEE
ncbi:MAG TPA: FG-GAP-like repeat-containing protein [Phycisphaerae bacterium]|nr:FG-GAP-like repeat-containing protein [Phycisphaerae bacterium]HNU46853.1 FG-GAP-like repeat-containing protein [Phycisphaerae bacterium]